MTAPIPAIRLRHLNDAPLHTGRDYVLYWMIAQRRLTHSFALQHAANLARNLNKPLVIFEPLRVGYRWASDRHHRFIIDGMRDHAAALAALPHITYYPYVEPALDADKGLLAQLAARACVVVTDDYPASFIPHMLASAARGLTSTRLDAVDSNGLLPLRAVDRVYTTAASFRLGLHKTLPAHLKDAPLPDPLAGLDPALKLALGALDPVTSRWPAASSTLLHDRSPAQLAHLPIDHAVKIAEEGGPRAAQARLDRWLARGFTEYHISRNEPDSPAPTGLSPHLHFGHISAHDLFARVMDRDRWTPAKIAPKPSGSREGWWGASAHVEAFLDELITWREIGYNMAAHAPDQLESFDSLADWIKETIQAHAEDKRDHVYSLAALEAAKTHDKLWNAAQLQLVHEGRIHNYLRMLWGKKILEWTSHPTVALNVMVELNNKYALDGRDPSSYSGIFWCLGRYDRGWTERPITGKLRYMSSDNTRKKIKVEPYIARWYKAAAASL
jgi:deoxyribodipyrimidine photo-lyase